jgi:Domain of unknown function (DUF4286)
MILFNITVNIDPAIEQAWLHWIKTDVLPAAIQTNLPVAANVLRLLTEIDNGGVTYTLQFRFADLDDASAYQNQYANDFDDAMYDRYPEKYVTFQTVLEYV